MPHITEELWHTLTGASTSGDEADCLALQRYPVADARQIDPDLEAQFELLIDTIRTIRNLRAEAGIKPSAKIETLLKTDSASELQTLQATRSYIQAMARVETLAIGDTDFAPVSEMTAETLAIAEAEEIVETGDLLSAQSATLWQRLSDATARFLDQPMRYFGSFFSGYKKPAFSLAIFLGGVMTIKVFGSMLAAIDDVPGLAGLFQVIGIIYAVRFVARQGYTAERRDRAIAKLKQVWAEVAGAQSSRAAASGGEAPHMSPAPTGVTPSDIIKAGSKAQPSDGPSPDQRKMFAGVTGTVQVLIPLTGVVDVEALRAKLEKDLGKAEGEMKTLGGRLSNQGFVESGPGRGRAGCKRGVSRSRKAS